MVKNLLPKIESSIKVAIEESSVCSGMVTPDSIKDMFSEFSRTINDRLETMQTPLAQNRTGTLNESPTTISCHNAPSGLYSYGDRFYDVPETFDLPDGIKLRLAFRLWLNGDKQRHSLYNKTMKTEKHDQTTTEYSTQGPQVLKLTKTGGPFTQH